MVATFAIRVLAGVIGAAALIMSAKKAGLDVGAETTIDLIIAFGPVTLSILLAVFAGYLARNAAAWLCVLVVLATLSLEMALFKEVAESVVAERVERQAPVHQSNERRQLLMRQLNEAEKAVPTRTPRLDLAIEAEKAVRAKRAEAAPKSTCRSGCVVMFGDDAKRAENELRAARAEFAELRADATGRLNATRQELLAIAPQRSATPLADMFDVKPWKWDLSSAVLWSFGLNVGGLSMLFFAGHGAGRRQTNMLNGEMPDAVENQASYRLANTLPAPAPKAIQNTQMHIAYFLADRMRHCTSGGMTAYDDLHALYRQWAHEGGHVPLSRRQLSSALKFVADKAGLEVAVEGRRRFLVGAVSKDEPILIDREG